MARTTSPEKIDAAKSKIIIAALEVIAYEGYSKFSLSSVAERVGITKAGLYWYFENKEDLLNELVAVLKADFIGSIREISQQPMPALQKIEQLVKSLEGNSTSNCFLLLKVFLEFYSVEHDIKNTIQESYGEYIDILERIFAEAIEATGNDVSLSAKSLARLFIATLDGCSIQNEILETRIEAEEILHLFDTLLSNSKERE